MYGKIRRATQVLARRRAARVEAGGASGTVAPSPKLAAVAAVGAGAVIGGVALATGSGAASAASGGDNSLAFVS